MKRLIVFLIAVSMTACAVPGLQKKPVSPDAGVKQNTIGVQKQNADAAFDELDKETGGKDADEPVVNDVPKTVPKPIVKEEPKPVVKEEPVVNNFVPKRNVKIGSSMRPVTKYPIENGYPVWFFTPNMDGYLGSVGVAGKQARGGISAQKRVAAALAQADLAKQIKVVVNAELTVEQTKVEASTVQYYRSKLSTLSRQKAEEYLKDFEIHDEWIDPNSNEYYVWLVLKK